MVGSIGSRLPLSVLVDQSRRGYYNDQGFASPLSCPVLAFPEARVVVRDRRRLS